MLKHEVTAQRDILARVFGPLTSPLRLLQQVVTPANTRNS